MNSIKERESKTAEALLMLTTEERTFYIDGLRRKYNLPIRTDPVIYYDEDESRLRILLPRVYDVTDPDDMECDLFATVPLFNKEQLRIILSYVNRYLSEEIGLKDLSKLINSDDFDNDIPKFYIKSRKQRYIIAIITVLSRRFDKTEDAMKLRRRTMERFCINPVTFKTEVSKIGRTNHNNPVKQAVNELMHSLESSLNPYFEV